MPIQFKDADFFYNRGFDRREAGKHTSAIADFSKAIELDPTHYKAHHHRAFSLNHIGKKQAAVTDMTAAIHLHPGDAELHFNRGVIRSDLQLWEEAIADFDQVLSLTPKDAQAHDMRGRNKYRLGIKFSSLHFVVTNPDTGVVTEIGAESGARSLELFEEAMHDFERAMALDADDEDVPRWRAMAQDRLADGRLVQRVVGPGHRSNCGT